MGRHRPDNCEAKVSIRTLAQGSMYQDAVRTNEVPGGEGLLRSAPMHTSYLSQTPQTCLCKKKLPSVNFYRFNAKNLRFFTDLTRKIGIYYRKILAFFVVNFILQKFCSCTKNDKYEVCHCLLCP